MTDPSPRTTVRRKRERGVYDRTVIDAILDEGLVAHVGIVDEGGRPVVIPMIYGRSGDRLYLHGLPASRLLRTLAAGPEVCVTVTLLDGLVLARSVFNHSVNYRSVVVFGPARLVRHRAAKLEALRVVTDHMVTGRWAEARGPNETELKGTYVLEVRLAECSAKVRSGPPKDDEADLGLPVWAGVLPLGLAVSEPVPASELPVPASVRGFRRRAR